MEKLQLDILIQYIWKFMNRILLVGNANSGKTSIFNSLTGLNQKVGNFHGVTVSYKIGKLKDRKEIEIIDLPGSYSLNSVGEDKKVLTRFLMNREKTDKVLFVLDGSQLERSLQFYFQIRDLGIQTTIAITMIDILEKSNISIDLKKLQKALGTKIYLVNSKKGIGIEELKLGILDEKNFSEYKKNWSWDKKRENFISKILKKISSEDENYTNFVLTNSLKELSGDNIQKEVPSLNIFEAEIQNFIKKEFFKSKLNFSYQNEILEKAKSIKKILSEVLISNSELRNKLDLDIIFLHPIFGKLIFFSLMFLIFQILFNFSEIPMNFIKSIFENLERFSEEILPKGPLQNLISSGILNGVGAVFVFIPQITFLFLMIGFLEESGYLSRILFLMDKFMGRFGLSGKSFVPLLSSSACAVPAILSTRTIENKSEKIITILISPLVTCSARYPVYILIIGTVFSDKTFFGLISLKGIILFSLFALGILTALGFAILFKKYFFKSENSYFLIELPEYRIPNFKNLFLYVYQNIKDFLLNSGKIIFFVSILLWFLANFPNPKNLNKVNVNETYIAYLGKSIEPIINPLGFDWKIGVGIIASFAAREVMVSSIAILYETDKDDTDNLSEKLKKDKKENGEFVWTTKTGISLLLFYAFASQCFSTLAVARKELNSIFWTIFLFSYMTLLAFTTSFIFYQLTELIK